MKNSTHAKNTTWLLLNAGLDGEICKYHKSSGKKETNTEGRKIEGDKGLEQEG
jgi:hypothetical protein